MAGASAGPAITDFPIRGVARPIGAMAGAASEIVLVPMMLVATGAAKGAPMSPALAVTIVRAARMN